MKAIALFVVLFVANVAHAEDIIFSQSDADGNTFRITLSSPHANPAYNKTALAPGQKEPETTQTWRAEKVSATNDTTQVIIQFEDFYEDPNKLGVTPTSPQRILAARAIDGGVVFVRVADGYVWGYVRTHNAKETPDNPVLLQAPEFPRDGKTKFSARIDGNYKSNDITTNVTSPDGTLTTFRLTVGKDKSHWDRIASSKTSSTTKKSLPTPATRPT